MLPERFGASNPTTIEFGFIIIKMKTSGWMGNFFSCADASNEAVARILQWWIPGQNNDTHQQESDFWKFNFFPKVFSELVSNQRVWWGSPASAFPSTKHFFHARWLVSSDHTFLYHHEELLLCRQFWCFWWQWSNCLNNSSDSHASLTFMPWQFHRSQRCCSSGVARIRRGSLVATKKIFRLVRSGAPWSGDFR